LEEFLLLEMKAARSYVVDIRVVALLGWEFALLAAIK